MKSIKKTFLAFAATLAFTALAQAETILLQVNKSPFNEYMSQMSYDKATLTTDGLLIVQNSDGETLKLQLDADTLAALKANVSVLENAKVKSYYSEIVCMMMPAAPRAHLFIGERLRAIYATGGCEYSSKLHPADASHTALAAAVVAKIDELIHSETLK